MKRVKIFKKMKNYYKMNFDCENREPFESREYINILRHLTNGSSEMWIKGVNSRSRQTKYALTTLWQCCICGKHFKESNNASSSFRNARQHQVPWITCTACDGHACTDSCAIWERDSRRWLCNQCVIEKSRSGESKNWFKSLLTALQPGVVTVRMSKSQPKIHGNVDPSEAVEDVSNDEKQVVRDFIERLVGAMLGADLDNTSVGRIYADAEYETMFDRYHDDISATLSDLGSALHVSIANLPVTGQTPCTAHASLKNIIRRVLRDASNMAILKQPQNKIEAPEATTSRTYEDLLATAILNKVIDNYQSDLRRSSSGSASSSKRSHKSRRTDEDHWSTCQQIDPDTASISSVEEWCRSESSAGEKYVDHLSFTIQQSIEEISTSDDENPSQQYLHSNRNRLRNNDLQKENYSPDEWQDNWLFSRKGKKSPNPVPVPMLVPNPSTDYRALIGDRDAEDTTDLSETGSDLEENESVQDIKTILVDSRTVIGGKNLLDNVNTKFLEEEIVNNGKGSGESEEKGFKLKNKLVLKDDSVSEARNDILIDETPYDENDSLESNTEKDAEYTEKYASFPRQISKNKMPKPSPRVIKSSDSDQQNGENNTFINNEKTQESIQNNEEDIYIEEAPMNLRGSYSEKEKEKWRNPVALVNNPYSKENLDKRLNNSINNKNFGFGRDYYVREAKKAAGGRKKLVEDGSHSENSGHDSVEESLPLIEEKLSEKQFNNNEQNIFIAVPVIVQNEETIEEENEDVPELESISSSRPISLALSTDSEDTDVKRIFNVETGKVFMVKNKDLVKEIIQDSKSPEGSKSIMKSDELISSNLKDEVDNKFDENHNKTFAIKEPIMNISNHISALTKETKNSGPKVFVQKQISHYSDQATTKTIEDIVPELKESSRKYLQSLVKNKVNPEVINSFSTPPISLQEFNTENSNKEENKIEIETDDPNILYKDYKSCIDLRFIPENRLLSPSYEKNETARSTPNLMEEKLFFPEDEDRENEQKLNIVSELDELQSLEKPSVRDLKKLFDKPIKVTLSRTKSHLTTKPELKSHRQVHSLTARSLSKEFRRDVLPELQKFKDDDHNSTKINGVPEEINEAEVDELKTIPPCKSKIAFFELLHNN